MGSILSKIRDEECGTYSQLDQQLLAALTAENDAYRIEDERRRKAGYFDMLVSVRALGCDVNLLVDECAKKMEVGG